MVDINIITKKVVKTTFNIYKSSDGFIFSE